MDDDIYIYVPLCKIILWSELDKNLRENKLSIFTVNARIITGKFAELEANSNFIKK